MKRMSCKRTKKTEQVTIEETIMTTILPFQTENSYLGIVERL
jgi:hypothetical protein